jgi:hypothetical protein
MMTCEYCQEAFVTPRHSLGRIPPVCPACKEGVAVDDAVKLDATRKARCGHLSPNYFACWECKRKEREGHLNVFKALRGFNPDGLKHNTFREAAPRLDKARGYTYCKRSGKFQVRFQTKHVGYARTAEEAREMYMKKVEEYRNAKSNNHQVSES